MELATLAHLLPTLQSRDCIVTFNDGDTYKIADLDIWGYYEDDFEIHVSFEHCQNDSAAKKAALASGYLRLQKVSWKSTKPFLPVGKTYLIQEIETIFDRANNYDVYSKNA